MKELVIVERFFDEPTDLAEVQAREDAIAWCLDRHGVRFLRTYFARDRRAMICLYRAPDAEAVRATQRQGGLPVTRAWSLDVHGDPEASAPAARELIVVERDFPTTVTLDFVHATFAREGHCLHLYAAELLASHLARDGRRMICVFAAPDAEAVRAANRRIGFPVQRAWPATLHVPASAG